MSTPRTNPLLAPAELPYGVPDYRAIDASDYLPAFVAAFAEQRREIDNITGQGAAPTFENTLLPLERSGELLERVSGAFYTVSSAHSTAEIQEVEEAVAPLFAAHSDAILLDALLFERVQAIHDTRNEASLDDESRFLVERQHRAMRRAGAGLAEPAKERLRAINQRLSTLTNTFERQLLDDTNALAVHIDDAGALDGLAPAELEAAAQAARDRGHAQGYLITLPLFTGHPSLAVLRDRGTRQRIMAASRARAGRGDANDNTEVLHEIVRLRGERARLLGFASHAAFVTADETAGSAEAVTGMLRRLAPAAARNAAREKEALQALVDATEPQPFAIAAHDWAFYTEKVRRARYALDTAALRPWFEAERVLRDGVFAAASELYGLSFAERFDIPVYHPDARVFEVAEADGTPLGLYILDLYTRPTKRGGAWMNAIVSQSRVRGTRPVVVNNLNVVKPAKGSPTLLTLDEVTTLFHEFGHALHGLFAEVEYPSFAGTRVDRDFVEFPSQVNEMWMLWPELLPRYARHVETGEPLDPEIVARLQAAESFNQGFATSEYLAAAWLDQAWHALTPEDLDAVQDVDAFEAAALAEIGLDDPAIPPRYGSRYFQHVFAGGYSAGYYSYIWSEVLDADTVEWFRENGGLSREAGERFRRRLLGVGGAKDPLAAYRDFRGRDARIEPLLARRALTD